MTVNEVWDPGVDDVEQEAHADDDGSDISSLYLKYSKDKNNSIRFLFSKH